MSENIGSTTSSGKQKEARLRIEDVYFEEGKLWMPRYPNLIKLALDGLQLEPAFQIDPQIRVVIDVSIAGKEKVVFDEDREQPGSVKCWSIDRPSRTEIPGIVDNELVDDKRCKLLWDPSQAEQDVTVLRLFCRHEHKAGGRRQADPDSEVEGGIYVVLLRRSRKELLKRKPLLAKPFKDTELEPAFRVRAGELATVDFLLRRGLEFEAGTKGDVKLFPLFPGPEAQLPELRARLGAEPRTCHLEWQSVYGQRFFGRAVSFHLGVVGLEEGDGVHATVVEPPTCSPNGICVPPPR